MLSESVPFGTIALGHFAAIRLLPVLHGIGAKQCLFCLPQWHRGELREKSKGVRSCNRLPARALVLMELIPTIWVKENDFPRREIASVPDAMEFLGAWPRAKRNPFFDLAENAMQAAINGSISVDEAREAFQSFCSEQGILAQDPLKD